MKKHVVAFCLLVMLALSSTVLAAAPDAKIFSTEQELAVRWTDTMFAQSKPVEARAMMGAEAQKAVDQDKIVKLSAGIAKDLGQYKSGRFVSWTRYDQLDQMVYLMSFEKQPAVFCVMLFSKQGELENFSLNPAKKSDKDQKNATDKK
jgi:membrane-bound inhibitor of C-type lysozyme